MLSKAVADILAEYVLFFRSWLGLISQENKRPALLLFLLSRLEGSLNEPSNPQFLNHKLIIGSSYKGRKSSTKKTLILDYPLTCPLTGSFWQLIICFTIFQRHDMKVIEEVFIPGQQEHTGRLWALMPQHIHRTRDLAHFWSGYPPATAQISALSELPQRCKSHVHQYIILTKWEYNYWLTKPCIKLIISTWR